MENLSLAISRAIVANRDPEQTIKLAKEVKRKFGTKLVATRDIYDEMTPEHATAVRTVGDQLRMGIYSLERFSGKRRITPLPENFVLPHKENMAP